MQTTRRRTRPYPVRVNIQLTTSLNERLREQADLQEVSVAELTRRLLDEGLRREERAARRQPGATLTPGE